MPEFHLDLMRDAAKKFPAVENPHAIRRARIWYCKYKSFAELGKLVNLEELVIAGFPDDSFACLESPTKLRHLSIVHLPKVTEIDALSALGQLTSLSLATLPSWDASRKTSTISSLAPLASLPQLAHLELLGVCPPGKSLAPLEQCTALRTARIAQYPRAEIDRFFSQTGVLNQFNPAPTFA